MLAHPFSSSKRTDSGERRLATFQRSIQTKLSIAMTIALSGFAVQGHAQTYNELPVADASVEYQSTRTSPMMDELLSSSNAPAEQKAFIASQRTRQSAYT